MRLVNLIPFALLLASCTTPAGERESIESISQRVFERARTQLVLLDENLPEGRMPRSLDKNGKLSTSDIGWWCSGFYPGSLWMVYEKTQDPRILLLAQKHTHKLYPLVRMKTDHDIGFQMMSSFGRGYRLLKEPSYAATIVQGARKLAERFSPTTGTIRSWDNDTWAWPVIIDNMMNLELLTFASRVEGGSAGDSLRQVAITHALTTMKNHFRDDYTSFHLVDYDPDNGHVRHRQTVQGYKDESAWARGQAWGLYGYTMMARELGFSQEPSDVAPSKEFLSQAENIARTLLDRLPEDGIPYWDFDAPGTEDPEKAKDVLRDASAGAIMASAFAELSTLTSEAELAKRCREESLREVRTLASEEYLSKEGEREGFLLGHSVGHLPGNSEVDVPLTYADYYFLEAILRLESILAK